MRHGHGSDVWPDGRCYVGEWRGDKANGHGVMMMMMMMMMMMTTTTTTTTMMMMMMMLRSVSPLRADAMFQIHTWPDGSTFKGEWIEDERADGMCAACFAL
jgi:hypothetical protein